MCSAPTHTALLTSLHTFIVSHFSSTLPLTKTNMLIVFLDWQKCYCEKMYLDSNWVGKNDDWLLDDDLGGRGRKKSLNLSLVHWGPALLPVLQGILSLCLWQWVDSLSRTVVFPSAQIEIQLFGFCNMTSSLLLWPWSKNVVNGILMCLRARVLQILEYQNGRLVRFQVFIVGGNWWL